MDFDFNDEQYLFQEATRGFLGANYSLDRLHGLLDGDGFDADLWRKLAETGAFGMIVPEEYGGMGLDLVDLSLVLEEYGRALVPSPVAETLIATDVIVRFGTEEQKKRRLPGIAEGRLRIVPALVEADAGYAPSDIVLAATPNGAGWKASGCKVLVPHAASADLILLALRTGSGGPLALAMIEPGRDGVTIIEQSTLDPSGRFYSVQLDGVSIAREDIIGGASGPAAVQRLFDVGGVVAATMMTGIASRVLDDSVEYAGQRIQFGKPIGSFQAIKHRCADIAVKLDSARSAAYFAAWALASDAPECEKAVSMAKSYCGEAARFACNECIQIHGGVGFTWELGLHFFLRRSKMLELSYGDAAYHRERVLAATLAELGIGN